jgi:eukaryotic-like serine/threonine-protein kinase
MSFCPRCGARYLDARLRACPADGTGLEPTPEPAPEAGAAIDRPLRAGEMVGEYQIEGRIGEGGFGVVYRAVQPLIGKRVAVKVLLRHYASGEEVVERFVAEARAVNRIRHRHIIDIFSFGVLPDGRHYYVMELLEGETLDVLLARVGTLSPALAVELLRPVARALDAAHAAGIVHRDLKPENIFLSVDRDEEVYPKLLDFGIAKLFTGAAASKVESGVPVGTPHYMSPEQCRGRDVDQRTDIYSFGVVTFRAFTGRLPFEGEKAMGVMMAQVSAQPPRPSAICPSLPPSIDAPLLQMLAKDPAARPASILVAVEALAAACGLMPMSSGSLAPPPFSSRSGSLTPPPFSSRPGSLAPPPLSSPPGSLPPGSLPPLSLPPPSRHSSSMPLPQMPVRTLLNTLPGAGIEASGVSNVALLSVPAAGEGRGGAPGQGGWSRFSSLLLGGVLLAAMGLGGFWLGRRGNPGGVAPIVTEAQPGQGPGKASGPAPAGDARGGVPAHQIGSSVRVRVRATPPADVYWGEHRLGHSEAGPLDVPRGASPVRLTLRAEGYEPTELEMTPDADNELTAVLVKKAPPSPGPSSSGPGGRF